MKNLRARWTGAIGLATLCCTRAPSAVGPPGSPESGAIVIAGDGDADRDAARSPDPLHGTPALGATTAAPSAVPPSGTRPLEGKHEGGLLALVFLSPDGARALSSGVDAVAFVHDLATGRVLRRFSGPAFAFNAAVPTRDGRHVIVSSRSGAHYWETDTGQIEATFPGWVTTVALSPDERSVAVVGDDGLEFWALAPPRLVKQLTNQAPQAVGYSTDGRRAFWVDDGDRLCAVEVEGVAPPRCRDLDPARRGFGDVRMGAVASTQTLTGNFFGTLSLWDNESGRLVRGWTASTKALNSVAFDADLHLAADVGVDRWVRVWRTDRLQMLAARRANKMPVSVALSRDGRHVLYDDGDGTGVYWTPSADGG